MTLLRKYFLHGFVVSLFLGGVFAFFGVYNTDELPFLPRYIFWTSTMITGTLTMAIAVPWVLNKALPGRHPAFQILAVAALISLPVTVVVNYFNDNSFTTLPLKFWVLQYAYVIVVSLITTTGGYISLRSLGILGPAPEEADTPPPAEKFMARLPVKYRGAALYAVSSEDHYLRVHTDRGEELILMRLADALRELEGAEGLQTHRSWWVAHQAVSDVQKSNGKLSLQLKSGALAPVSRSFAKDVKEAGLSA